ncbi:MAG: hypothetical protein A3E01_00155 [Gammaproteobacteria bacterium RIFCSPHIGHO2_12_FULL_63_22]|nr:MAG: hypothetical protein A3E01_00155 [Gammaproteobacteria bacterium RIFCSPHIGHO2_12_FULL_63_22]
MNETMLLALAASLVAAMFGLLCAILGWLGNRIYNKVDEMSNSLTSMASELHTRISGIDRRVTVVETRCMDTYPGFKAGT